MTIDLNEVFVVVAVAVGVAVGVVVAVGAQLTAC